MMETDIINSNHDPGYTDPLVKRIARKIRVAEYSSNTNRDTDVDINIDIKRRGKWFVLRGFVDSYKTKLKLFSWVPKFAGKQHIVDKVRVRNTSDVEG